jgi:Protein of unknown function (DUF2577)
VSGDRLYSLFKNIAGRAFPEGDQTDLLYGVVKSVHPLRVEIENKYTIDENQIYLSPLCVGKTIQITVPGHTHSTYDGSTGTAGALDLTIELWRDLRLNDVLVLLRHSKGQAFYALQRVGALE